MITKVDTTYPMVVTTVSVEQYDEHNVDITVLKESVHPERMSIIVSGETAVALHDALTEWRKTQK